MKQPSGIIMFASRVGTPRLLDAIWKNDDLRYAIRIRTGDYRLFQSDCNSVGCPRMKFQVTRGSLTLTVIKKQVKLF